MRGRGRLAERRAAPPWSKPGAQGDRSLVVREHGKALRPSRAGLEAAVKGGICGCVEVCAALWRMLRIGNRSGAGGGPPITPIDVEAAGIGAVGKWLKRLFPRMGEGVAPLGPRRRFWLGDTYLSI